MLEQYERTFINTRTEKQAYLTHLVGGCSVYNPTDLYETALDVDPVPHPVKCRGIVKRSVRVL